MPDPWAGIDLAKEDAKLADDDVGIACVIEVQYRTPTVTRACALSVQQHHSSTHTTCRMKTVWRAPSPPAWLLAQLPRVPQLLSPFKLLIVG